jgi:2-methylaconitate cis-trans-isomerase PrpF
MTGTGAVAIGVAAAIPGTIVHRLVPDANGAVRFGHPSGSLAVGAEAVQTGDSWVVTKVMMSRSARRLVVGHVFVPSSVLEK